MKNPIAKAIGFFSYIRLLASYIGSASYICPASDIARGQLEGEYNITFAERKYHSGNVGISLDSYSTTVYNG